MKWEEESDIMRSTMPKPPDTDTPVEGSVVGHGISEHSTR